VFLTWVTTAALRYGLFSAGCVHQGNCKQTEENLNAKRDKLTQPAKEAAFYITSAHVVELGFLASSLQKGCSENRALRGGILLFL